MSFRLIERSLDYRFVISYRWLPTLHALRKETNIPPPHNHDVTFYYKD